MTKPCPFTELTLRKAIAAMRKEGLEVKAVTIRPDGTVTIHHDDVAQPLVPGQDAGDYNPDFDDIRA